MGIQANGVSLIFAEVSDNFILIIHYSVEEEWGNEI